jgi:hypothetical protein
MNFLFCLIQFFTWLACLNQIIPVLIDWKYWFTSSQLEAKMMGLTLSLGTHITKSLLGIPFLQKIKNGNSQVNFVGMSLQWMGVRNVEYICLFSQRLLDPVVLCCESLK